MSILQWSAASALVSVLHTSALIQVPSEVFFSPVFAVLSGQRHLSVLRPVHKALSAAVHASVAAIAFSTLPLALSLHLFWDVRSLQTELARVSPLAVRAIFLFVANATYKLVVAAEHAVAFG